MMRQLLLLSVTSILLFPSLLFAGEVTTIPDDVIEKRRAILDEMGVSAWHKKGDRGKGVKIAVLDTGFQGYRTLLGKALPETVSVRSFRSDGNIEARKSQHGILCGEVIHAVAPDAELLFADWDVGESDQFLSAVRWAKEQGARIVSCSVIAPSWSDGEGGGDVHESLAKLIGAGTDTKDLLFFASAGNTTDRHWSGTFDDDGRGYHEWKDGVIDNGLRPWSDEKIHVEMYWHPGTEYDLEVLDAANNKVVAVAHTTHNDRIHNSAVIRFFPEQKHSYRVRVRLVHGVPSHFHLTTTWGSLSQTNNKASVCFPADGKRVIALGAVDDEWHRQWYSACGPNSPAPKPDLVAKVPFPSSWRERPFGGTSAAAPQAAALAAVLLSAHTNWNPEKVRSVLQSSARDLEKPGHDFETGYGVIRLPKE